MLPVPWADVDDVPQASRCHSDRTRVMDERSGQVADGHFRDEDAPMARATLR